MVIRIPRAELVRMETHAREAYPDECCGLLSGPADEPGILTAAHPCRNLQNQYHQRFPEEYPRDAQSAYLLDYRELERVDIDVQTRGRRVKGIFHSHVDVGAYFSAEDKRVALMGGDEPSYPEFVHVVIDARADAIHGGKAFAWDPDARDFREVPLEIQD